jgi:integrase/recombinase XerC
MEAKHVREWIAHLSARGLKAWSRAPRLAGLRSMFDYLVDADVVVANPCRRVWTPKEEEQPPVYLTPDECARLLDATDSNHSHGVIRGHHLLGAIWPMHA